MAQLILGAVSLIRYGAIAFHSGHFHCQRTVSVCQVKSVVCLGRQFGIISKLEGSPMNIKIMETRVLMGMPVFYSNRNKYILPVISLCVVVIVDHNKNGFPRMTTCAGSAPPFRSVPLKKCDLLPWIEISREFTKERCDWMAMRTDRKLPTIGSNRQHNDFFTNQITRARFCRDPWLFISTISFASL